MRKRRSTTLVIATLADATSAWRRGVISWPIDKLIDAGRFAWHDSPFRWFFSDVHHVGRWIS